MKVLTFQSIREIQRKERNNSELQELDKNFYTLISDYLNQKKASMERAKTESEKKRLNLEFENAKKIIQELIGMREQKIAIYALQSLKTEIMQKLNMTPNELELFTALVQSYKEFEKQMEKKLNEKRESKYKVVKVLKEIDAFLGEDMKKYGPLKKDDVITLPPQVAKVLVDQGKAEEVSS